MAPTHDIILVYMSRSSNIIIPVLISIIAAGAIGYGGYRYHSLAEERDMLTSTLADTHTDLASTTNALHQLEQERASLQEQLDAEQARVGALASQVETVTNTVGVLEKLNTIDPELLKKYSRVYFLNENYMPRELAAITESYLYEPHITKYILSDIESFLIALMNAGLNLKIISAYRSFGEQAELKYSYAVTYGTGANQFSADQGYSEHQIGTAIDFTTGTTGANFNAFEDTQAYAWLKDNAHTYGFVLSYPEENAYYHFEPWHWRFVGRELAEKLHNENKYFYDLDQRLIDTYLISFFN